MKSYIKAAVWLLALILCLFGMDQALRRGDGKLKYQAFFEEKMDYDIFFLGTSHMMDAVYPIELWRDYGITSYNLGNTAEPMDNTYWTLRLASAYHVPKVVVIDVAYMDRIQTTQMHTYQFAHGFLDEIPLSLDKIRAVWSIFPDGSVQSLFSRWRCIILAGRNSLTALNRPIQMRCRGCLALSFV